MKENEKTAGWKRAAWLVNRCNEMSRKTKLAFYRELRSLGVLPKEATFWLIEWEILIPAESRFDKTPESRRLLTEIGNIEDLHSHGNPDFTWPPGKGPKRYRAINARWEKLRHEYIADALRNAGEKEMAEFYLADPDAFNKTSVKGREYFWREFTPKVKRMDKRIGKVIRTILDIAGKAA